MNKRGKQLSIDDPLAVYLAAVKKVPPLSREEELECIHLIRAGADRAGQAGKRLIEANLSMVVTLAESYPPGEAELLDLIEAGNRGLMAGVQTLRDSSTDHFQPYAKPLVERAIADAAAAPPRAKTTPPHLM